MKVLFNYCISEVENLKRLSQEVIAFSTKRNEILKTRVTPQHRQGEQRVLQNSDKKFQNLQSERNEEMVNSCINEMEETIRQKIGLKKKKEHDNTETKQRWKRRNKKRESSRV